MKFKYITSLLIILFITNCSNKNISYQKHTRYPKHQYYTLKPYKVLGKWYYPRYVNVGEIFRGVSSWYGPDFHGKLTASGEVYNMYEYTAANKIMPFGTIIKVINLNNHKSVIVKINDRGPFMKGRILDLSYSAGKKIGLNKTGIAPVKIIVLKVPKIKHKYKKKMVK